MNRALVRDGEMGDKNIGIVPNSDRTSQIIGISEAQRREP